MIKSNSFIKDIITLSSVPLISQILGLLLTPIVTRIYAPEEFGILNTFASLTAFLGVIATLAFHSSILLPKKDSKAFNMLIVCFISTIFFTSISGLIIFIFHDLIIDKLNIVTLKSYIFLIPLFVFLHGTFQTLRFWNTRFKNFTTIAISKASEVITNKAVVLGLGFSGYITAGSLILGVLIASMFKNLVLLKNFFSRASEIKNVKSNHLIEGAKRYVKFPKYSLWSELLSRTPALIIVLLILKFFDSTVLGYYALCIMVLNIPTVFITSSIMEAFSPRAAEAKHTNKHIDLLKEIYQRVVSLTIFPFIILVVYGDVLFGNFFGEEWFEAGLIAQIFVFRVFCEIIFDPIISLTVIIEKQEINLLRRVLNIIVITISLLVGGYYENYFLAFILLSISQGLATIFIGNHLMKIMKIKISSLFNKTKYYFKLSIFFLITLVLSKVVLNISFIMLIITFLLLAFIYYYLVFLHDKVLFHKIKNILINNEK